MTDETDTDALVEKFAEAICVSDGLNWSEPCAYEADEDADSCYSGTCVAAFFEDHDPSVARDQYRRHARAAIAAMPEATTQAVQIAELKSALDGVDRDDDALAHEWNKAAAQIAALTERARVAEADQLAGHAEALRKIAFGSEDSAPPFRVMEARRMQHIASTELRKDYDHADD